jgi:phospholipase C
MNKQNNNDSPSNEKGSTMSRRSMLKTLGGLTAGAFASPFIPPHVRNVLASSSKQKGSFRDIEHVVLLMQENRSFDHYFGTLSGVRGFDDPNPMKLENGRTVFHQPDSQNPDGYLLPFHLNTRKSNAQAIPSTSHSWPSLHASWNQGKMNKWVSAHRKVNPKTAPYVMGHYTREDIPFQFALAEAFTICDAYHSSMMGPTWPNRMYWMSATVDPEGTHGGPLINNRMPKGGFRWTTYAERLEKAGISWNFYQQKNSLRCKLDKFKAFRDADKNSSLYKRGMEHNPVGQFEYDAINDNLPAVSWIVPPHPKDEHPAHLPADGAAFVASKIDAIAANPEVWAKTVFILNYDENDGLFDHVPPPVPKPGTPGEFINGKPIGAGFRVPCIIISPWTAGGWVCSDQFDHTSTLQFLEKFTGVRASNITQWRRDNFGDLTSAFRFKDKESPSPTLPDTHGPRIRAKYEVKHFPKPKVPGANQSMPKQEKGTRKHTS